LAPDHGAALSQLLFLRRRQADWHDLAALRRAFRRGVDAGRPLLSPFVLLSDPSTRAQQRRCAEAWTAALAPPRPGPHRTLDTGSRLKVGYLSADFHTHATAFLAAGVFERHDRQAFEVIAYSTGPDDGSPMRARLVAAFDRFVDARGQSPEQLAAAIRADGIDLLVDLKGHTEAALTPVLAQRPAPIQVQWLGYPGTMGAPYIDYLVGDAVVTPFEEATDYAETIVQLPVCYQPNDRQRPIAPPEDREALGLPPDAIVFCSFNNSFKFNPEVVDAMAQILSRTTGSVLWLLERDAGDPALANLRREFVARGIAAERVLAAGWRPNDRYLALYHHADVFLDTWPYGAHTTASDALWAGCPVLTWPGETFASRVASSLLRAVGLPELVAASAADYVERAVHLAHDGDLRARLRAYLAGPGRASPLFDTESFVRALERAYLTMAEQFRAGRREPFRVSADGASAAAPTPVGE
jgi:predicted O-linked N-acetylglucosamine transferase (SPINDLY family)